MRFLKIKDLKRFFTATYIQKAFLSKKGKGTNYQLLLKFFDANTNCSSTCLKLKAKWKKPSYDEADLRKIFSKYGDILNVVVMSEKRVGLVEMKTKSAAVFAANTESGYAENPLKIKNKVS